MGEGMLRYNRKTQHMNPTLRAGVVAVVAVVAATLTMGAQSNATRARVSTLASDAFAGREAGSAGERLAAEYLASQLARLGAKPLPGRTDMFVPFDFTAGSRDGGSRVRVGSTAFDAARDVLALSFSDDGEVTGAAVFAGYGIVVPETQQFGYDSYAGLDVADKVVVVLRYFPEDADQQTRALLARYADLRYKAMAARQHGARGLLVVTGPRSPNAGLTVPMSFDAALAGSGIPAASVSGAVADALFAGSRSLDAVQRELDTGNPHAAGFPLATTVSLKTSLVRETKVGRNVVAYVPATAPVADAAKPWVAVGAHYDHLGLGQHGNSLAGQDEAGKPHAGADDNASGSAAVLAISEGIAKQPVRRRHLLVALWSAEELGLVGSSAFVNAAPVPIDQLAAYVNFDMVGRMRDNKLAVQATGTSPIWNSVVEDANKTTRIDLTLQADPYQPTDVATFNQAGVPSLNFTTGAHMDYHKPSDTADKIDYEDLDRIAALGMLVVQRLMDREEAPAFAKVAQSSQTGTRTGLRVFTGTVPDYTSDAKGLLLGGVVGGGPADQAGLQKGDVIVEIAGQTIANIYDYTYALELLKADQQVKVVFMRGSERHETTLTPVARR
jgi:hypothetical protein